MKPQLMRWARLAVASSAAAVLIGCDNSESAQIDQQARALAVRLGGGDGAAVAAEITSAAEGSLPVNVQANQLLAQARLSDARALANALTIRQSEADMIVSRISSLASVAGVTATISNTYRQQEPTASIALIKDLAAKARGDGNAEKFSDLPSGSIPTLAAVKQEKSRLEGDLAKAQGELADATSKRGELLSRVGALSSQADQQRGEERLATVTQAADLRQQAAVVSRAIGEHESAISRLNADLEIQITLESQLDSAVKSFAAQQSALEQGWETTKSKVTATSALANSILTSDAENSETSVKSLTSELNALIRETDESREQTLAAFADAATKFGNAKTAADAFGQSVSTASSGTSAETAAWNSLKSTLHGDRFIIQKAIALREQAAVHTSHAQFLLHMASVAASLEQVAESLSPPAAVSEPFDAAKLKAAAADAVKKADELLTESKDLVEGASSDGGDLAGLMPLKYSTKIFLNYDRALLSQLAAGGGIEADVAREQVYNDSIESAKAAIVAAREASVAVPGVPEEIYVAPAKPVEEKPTEVAAAEAAPDTPEITELRQAIKDLVGQVAGSPEDPAHVETLFARIKTDDSSQSLVFTLRELMEAGVRLNRVTKEKFGDEGVAALKGFGGSAGGAGMDPEQTLKKIDELKFTQVDESHITLSPPAAPSSDDATETPTDESGEASATEPPAGSRANPIVAGLLAAVKFVKEDDIWKLDLTQLPPGLAMMTEVVKPQFNATKDKVQEVAGDVENGKITNVDELKTALQALIPAGATPAAPTPETETPSETPPAEEGATPAENQ